MSDFDLVYYDSEEFEAECDVAWDEGERLVKKWASNQDYNERNREAIAAQSKERREKDPQKNIDTCRANYRKHRKALLAQKKLYYIENHEEIKTKRREYVHKNRDAVLEPNRRTAAWCVEFLGGACVICNCEIIAILGDRYATHHLDPSTKTYTVSSILSGPEERLVTELEKCILLCAPCHNRCHFGPHKNTLSALGRALRDKWINVPVDQRRYCGDDRLTTTFKQKVGF